jgi:hypothetical protein
VTLEELQQRLIYWQGVLRLQDWRIDLRWATWHEIGEAADAHIEWNSFECDAEITVIEEAHYFAPRFGRRQHYDPEFYLLHELLHLTLAMWSTEKGTAEDLAQEQAINHLAGALLDLDRRAQKLLVGAPSTSEHPSGGIEEFLEDFNGRPDVQEIMEDWATGEPPSPPLTPNEHSDG